MAQEALYKQYGLASVYVLKREVLTRWGHCTYSTAMRVCMRKSQYATKRLRLEELHFCVHFCV